LFNSYAQIPFAGIQGMGRADLTAKVHVLELLLFTGVALALIVRFGVLGAAVAWSLRALADCLVLTLIYGHLQDGFQSRMKVIVLGLYCLPLVVLSLLIWT
jgi:O-antigen/teichoic acid export membrane protein